MYKSNIIDKTIQANEKEGLHIDFIRSNMSSKMLDTHNTKYNIIMLGDGRKLAVKNVLTFKGGNVVKSAFLEIYYIYKEDKTALYYMAYSKENSKGINTYKLPYTGQIKL
ncbi:MAG: hypothetical protein QM660_10990 [Dysgonomonas sp.]